MNTLTESPGGSSHSRSLEWFWELLVLSGLAVPATALFWLTDLDLAVARLFYFPQHPDGAWPLGHWWLWEATYKFAPLAGAALALSAAVILGLATIRPRMVRPRLGAATLLLTLLLGPGLLVNVVFKDHWGHARPRQVIDFGGDMAYQPPLKPAFAQEGRSFVCGHCSIGFSLLAFWFIFKRRWRRLAWGSLAVGTAAGLIIGVSRIAAGAHFLSDVLWSGILVFIAAWFAYYLLLRVPMRVDKEAIVWPKRLGRRWLAAAFYVLLAGIFGAATALRTPLRADLRYQPSERELATTPTSLVVTAPGLNLDVDFVAGPASALRVLGEARGTGAPWGRVEAIIVPPTGANPTLTYEVITRGTVTKLGGRLRLSLPTDLENARISGNTVQLGTPPGNAVRLPRLRLEAKTR